MSTELSSDPIDTLRVCLQTGLKASPLCVAILGWLCDVPTEPSVAQISLRWGQVALRMSDEATPSPFGSLVEFLDQIRLACDSLGLTHAQTARVVSWARHRLA